jgi:hypothetical protein
MITGLAIFVHLHGRTLTDDLLDLLIETIHHIGTRAEHRVDRELLEDLRPVTGKQNLLFEVAAAALDKPDGIVRMSSFRSSASRLCVISSARRRPRARPTGPRCAP